MQTEHLHPGWSLLREYPLTPQLLAVSQAWQLSEGDDVVVASKGAPEAMKRMLDTTVDKVRDSNIDLAATWTDEFLPAAR